MDHQDFFFIVLLFFYINKQSTESPVCSLLATFNMGTSSVATCVAIFTVLCKSMPKDSFYSLLNSNALERKHFDKPYF